MDNLNYWKDKWIEVGKDYILNKKSTKETIEVWDNTSKNYDKTVSDSRISIIRKLVEEGYINKDSVVLDLGCGTGTYTVELSKICKEIHALDFSEGMLDVLKDKINKYKLKNINIIKSDWNELDLKKENMYKKYDFVLSSLNPGCYNSENLLKINEASKDSCCYIATDGKGKNNMLKSADDFILGEKIVPSDISNIIYPFNILYFSDYNPSLFYVTCDWISETNYEGAIKKLRGRYKEHLNEDIEEKIKEFVKDNINDGVFVDESKNTLGVILWKTR